MGTGLYPENGSVVIVDDQIAEALPLMEVLSKMDISFKYFTGNADGLPDAPLKNVKILFLDIQLEGMEGVLDDKTKMASLANVIKKIIDKRCSPYIIIAWTKHNELIEDLKKILSKEVHFPPIVLCMAKEECKVNDTFNLQKVSEKLNDQTKNFKSFKYFIFWQNIVNNASSIIVNDIASLARNNNRDEDLQRIFKLLAEAYAGKQATEQKHDKYSMLCFNNLLVDIIESLILKQNTDTILTDKQQDVNPVSEAQIKGEINRRLHISLEENSSPVPGNIYESNDNINSCFNIKKENLLSSIFNRNFEEFNNKDELIKQTELIFAEVSPFCDYAQNKWRRARILPGIKWPDEFESNLKRADYIYKSPVLKFNDKLYHLVFDIRYLTSVEIKKLKGVTSTKRIRKELLNDIQSKISAHINRPGITSL